MSPDQALRVPVYRAADVAAGYVMSLSEREMRAKFMALANWNSSRGVGHIADTKRSALEIFIAVGCDQADAVVYSDCIVITGKSVELFREYCQPEWVLDFNPIEPGDAERDADALLALRGGGSADPKLLRRVALDPRARARMGLRAVVGHHRPAPASDLVRVSESWYGLFSGLPDFGWAWYRCSADPNAGGVDVWLLAPCPGDCARMVDLTPESVSHKVSLKLTVDVSDSAAADALRSLLPYTEAYARLADYEQLTARLHGVLQSCGVKPQSRESVVKRFLPGPPAVAQFPCRVVYGASGAWPYELKCDRGETTLYYDVESGLRSLKTLAGTVDPLPSGVRLSMDRCWPCPPDEARAIAAWSLAWPNARTEPLTHEELVSDSVVSGCLRAVGIVPR